MKLATFCAILALMLFTACGSDGNNADTDIRPADVWTPFVQVAPPGNIFDVHAYQAVDHAAIWEARQERLAYEIMRIYEFFDLNRIPVGQDLNHSYPDYFGGFGWSDDLHYVTVLIVEGHEDDAADFLSFLEDFETVRIQSSARSFIELVHVSYQIWNSDVYPVLWWPRIDTMSSSVVVYLFNYSEEEKEFFRESVMDLPFINFVCSAEAYGEAGIWNDPNLMIDRLYGVTLSVQARDAFNFTVHIHNEPGLENLFAHIFFLETYLNGRWIPIFSSGVPIPYPSRDNLLLLELGTSEFEVNIGHFTRRFDGPYRISVNIWHNMESHYLTYIFSHGG